MTHAAIGEVDEKLIRRFEDKFIPEPNSGCWIWTARQTDRGYGQFGIGRGNKVASRVAYRIYRCVEPGDLQVLHKCDNPSCVNPDHLFLGTNRDNCLDKAMKGRVPHAKLTPSDIPVIRYMIGKGATCGTLAIIFGVSHKAIRQIRDGEAWVHVL